LYRPANYIVLNLNLSLFI